MCRRPVDVERNRGPTEDSKRGLSRLGHPRLRPRKRTDHPWVWRVPGGRGLGENDSQGLAAQPANGAGHRSGARRSGSGHGHLKELTGQGAGSVTRRPHSTSWPQPSSLGPALPKPSKGVGGCQLVRITFGQGSQTVSWSGLISCKGKTVIQVSRLSGVRGVLGGRGQAAEAGRPPVTCSWHSFALPATDSPSLPCSSPCLLRLLPAPVLLPRLGPPSPATLHPAAEGTRDGVAASRQDR